MNSERLIAFTVFGSLLTGPINFVWLNALEKWTSQIVPTGGFWARIGCKVFLQSTILQPFIYLPTFYSVTSIVRGWSPTEAYVKVREAYPGTLVRLWMFWTPCVVYTFGWLPVRQQAVFFSGVGFAWNVVLSLTQSGLFATNPPNMVAESGSVRRSVTGGLRRANSAS